ncbi:unnamed protein product [Paramecium octaurelia]|uniref:Transmembrane protein n=1 Tax=Paramecium octaurelia TaxID=43137 RepID=A0A8S1X9L0_PAROT|nr:unnamed protein product [Paramecium octaurelia]
MLCKDGYKYRQNSQLKLLGRNLQIEFQFISSISLKQLLITIVQPKFPLFILLITLFVCFAIRSSRGGNNKNGKDHYHHYKTQFTSVLRDLKIKNDQAELLEQMMQSYDGMHPSPNMLNLYLVLGEERHLSEQRKSIKSMGSERMNLFQAIFDVQGCTSLPTLCKTCPVVSLRVQFVNNILLDQIFSSKSKMKEINLQNIVHLLQSFNFPNSYYDGWVKPVCQSRIYIRFRMRLHLFDLQNDIEQM